MATLSEVHCVISYLQINSWSEGPSTGIHTYWSAGVKINNDQNWWISGGCCNSKESVLYDGTNMAPFSSLQTEENNHHMISIDDSHVIFMEDSGNGSVRLFDLTTNTWTPFTSLPKVSTNLYDFHPKKAC